MKVIINPYHKSVTIDGVEVVQKFINFPDALNHLASISCDYDRDSQTITDVQDVHRYVSHAIEKQYYYKHLPEFVDWFYAEQQAQLDNAISVEQQIVAANTAAQNAATSAEKAKLEAEEAKKTNQNTQQAVDNAVAKLTQAGSTLPVKSDGTDIARTLGERFADVVNVKDFGAVGDGVTDDTEAFEAAAKTLKKVFVPSGNYKITEALTGYFFSFGEITIPEEFVSVEDITQAKDYTDKQIIIIKDTLREEVERASGGKRTILRNSDGVPSTFWILPRFNLNAIDSSWEDSPHPAFIVGDHIKPEIFIGAYTAHVINGKANSLAGVRPCVGNDAMIDGKGVNFYNAVQWCRNSGNNFHLMTNAEWAALALWCWKMGYAPSGNSAFGCNGRKPWETGRLSPLTDDSGEIYNNWPLGVMLDDRSNNRPTLTGSGPNTWYHDGTSQGIADLVGNTMEWIAGVRCDDGMLQFIPNNNAALPTARFDDAYSTGSDRYWKTINPISGGIIDPRSSQTKIYFDGSYNADGTEATDGYGRMMFNTSVLHPDDGSIDVGSAYSYFTALGFNSSVTPNENTIKLLKQMALLPMGSGVQQGRCYARVPRVNNVPRMLGRGGAYYYENAYEAQDKDPFVGLFAYSVANLADAQGYPMSFRVCSYA